MATVLFISPEDLKRKTILDGNVDTDKLTYQIEMAQVIHIQDLLGTDLYERLQAGVTAADLNANETILLNTYVQDTLIHFTAAQYLPFAAYNSANGGFFKHTPENSITVDKSEVDALAQKERDFAQYFAQRLIDYLCSNSTLFPEYSTNTENDINPNTTLRLTGSWFLAIPLMILLI